MSDDRLRELERTFHQTRALADEVRWHTERLRVGEVTSERLQLAAYLGHAASREVVGTVVPGTVEAFQAKASLPKTPSGSKEHWEMPFKRWGLGLLAWGETTVVRMLLAFLWRSLPLWDTLREAQDFVEPLVAAEAFEDWVLCPCPKHLDDVVRLKGPLSNISDELDGYGAGSGLVWQEIVILQFLERIAATDDAATWLNQGLSAAYWSHVASLGRGPLAQDAPSWEPLRTVVVEALLPWALGQGDPIRDRRAARRG
jgi:hypothetical protein